GEPQPLGELLNEGRTQASLCPAIENEPQIGKTAGLQIEETVDVVLEAALRAGERIGLAGPPDLEAIEQWHPHLAPALGAPGLLEKVTGRYIDAAVGDDLQTVVRP